MAINLGSSSQGRIKLSLWLGFLSLILYLSGFLVWLTPLPILFAYKRRGRPLAWPVFGLAFLILAIVYIGVIPSMTSKSGIEAVAKYFFWLPGVGAYGEGVDASTFGIAYFIFYGIVGIMVGEREPVVRDITQLMSKVVLTLMGFLLILIFWKTGANWRGLVTDLEKYFVTVLDTMAEVTKTGTDMQQQLAFLNNYKEKIAYYAVRLLPGMAINSIIFITWLNIVVSKKLFFKEVMFPKMGPLRNWQLPFIFVWIVIGTAVFLIADIYLLKVNYLKIIAINAFIVFGLIYFFQGLSIAAYFIRKWSLSPIIKFFFYILFIIFFQPIGILLLAFGFFDSWFDFRKLTPKVTSS